MNMALKNQNTELKDEIDVLRTELDQADEEVRDLDSDMKCVSIQLIVTILDSADYVMNRVCNNTLWVFMKCSASGMKWLMVLT